MSVKPASERRCGVYSLAAAGKRACTAASRPGVDRAASSLSSSTVRARQYSGTSQETRAPTLTGQNTAAVGRPAASATSHRVGARMSCAYQYQPSALVCSGSSGALATMPWRPGSAPVTKVVWVG